jgi:diaminopimelate decarboxylase
VSATFGYRNGELHVEDVGLARIADVHGTPCYVYSRAAIAAAYRTFDSAIGEHPHQVCFAVKANGNLAILHELARLGCGFDIVSGGELERVLRAGGDPGRIVYSGAGKTEREMRAALAADIACFNVESIAELELLDATAGTLGRRARVALRINPDVDARTHPYIATGLAEHKFGIPMGEADAAYERAAGLMNIDVAGVAAHIGSQILELGPFERAAECVAGVAERLSARGIAIEHVDLGGGLGIGYGHTQAPSPAEYAKAILGPFQGRPWRVLIEPGRALVAAAGALLCRVTYLKRNGARRFAIVDAGMSELLRPALYQAWHPILPVLERPEVEEQVYDVVGPLCESADFLARERALRLAGDDLLAVLDAGAYGFVMSSNYNGRARPPELMVDGRRVHVVRARETVEAQLALERILP